MANSRAQRKVNRAKLKVELWKLLNNICQNNIENPRGVWKIFVRKHLDTVRFESDPMYKQEMLFLKREFEGIVKNIVREIIEESEKR